MRRFQEPTAEQGATLLETVIALFLLASGMMVCFLLFHRALQRQAQVELRATALSVASARLEEIRLSARDFGAFESLRTAASQTNVVPDAPGLEMTVDYDDLSTGDRRRAIPSRAFDNQFATTPPPPVHGVGDVFAGTISSDGKVLGRAFVGVDVTVRSRSALFPPIQLTTYLREPTRLPSTVVVSAPSTLTVNHLESSRCTAQVMDDANRPIADAVIKWTAEPVTGTGVVYQSRGGGVGVLCNVDFDRFGNVVANPFLGTCRLRATARIDGRTVSGVSEPVELLSSP